MNYFFQPIIIIGMHRSGTSMITKILREMGLFVGWDINDEYEAMFFLNRNEKILNACSCNWYDPGFLDNLLNYPFLRKKVINTLRNDFNSLNVSNYLGPKLFLKYRSVFNLDFLWGWKDPRNTFLLPLWIDLFPKAKIIHVYRNGIDIAQSLSVRERERINSLLNVKKSFGKSIKEQLKQINNESLLLYSVRKIQNRYRKMNTLNKYKRFEINPCISLKKGFELWCIYMEKAFENIENLQNEILSIKYEDFLLEPVQYLKKLKEFSSLTLNEDKIHRISAMVKSDRRYAFKDNDLLMNFFDSVKDNYWIRRLGYNVEDSLKIH